MNCVETKGPGSENDETIRSGATNIAPSQKQERKMMSCAPFVQTPVEVARKIIQLADLKPMQKLFDLGAGDGRLVVMVAQETGASSNGVEMEGDLVERARSEIKRLSLEDRVSMIHDDFFKVDLSGADVVILSVPERQ